jgi:hypothetical protein
MAQVIVYPNESGSVSLITPGQDFLNTHGITEVARKDVPAGTPYLIVDDATLPSQEYFNAWEADFTNPDGVGIGPAAWFAERGL